MSAPLDIACTKKTFMPIGLPPIIQEVKNYFGTLTLKFAGGSNNDRGGSLNCKLVR
jgi:hypothetical protein